MAALANSERSRLKNTEYHSQTSATKIQWNEETEGGRGREGGRKEDVDMERGARGEENGRLFGERGETERVRAHLGWDALGVRSKGLDVMVTAIWSHVKLKATLCTVPVHL